MDQGETQSRALETNINGELQQLLQFWRAAGIERFWSTTGLWGSADGVGGQSDSKGESGERCKGRSNGDGGDKVADLRLSF